MQTTKLPKSPSWKWNFQRSTGTINKQTENISVKWPNINPAGWYIVMNEHVTDTEVMVHHHRNIREEGEPVMQTVKIKLSLT